MLQSTKFENSKTMLQKNKTDIALLLMRLAFGGFMLYGHGWGKLLRLTSGDPIKFADPFGIGPEASLVLVVIAEFLCALLLMLGLFSRYATIPLIITMLVAAFVAHGGDPFAKQEKALMYLIAYISLYLTGPGAYSLDASVRKVE